MGGCRLGGLVLRVVPSLGMSIPYLYLRERIAILYLDSRDAHVDQIGSHLIVFGALRIQARCESK
jgi:hypothetical protein